MAMASMRTDESPEYVSTNAYGYGTMISLTEDQVEALGLKDNPPATGSTVGVRAIAIVVTKTETADVDGDGDGVDVCLCLQLTDMEITPGGMVSSDASSMLYGS